MTIIANTTVISNFSAIRQIDLLRSLHRTVHISVQVYEEIQKGWEEGYGFYADIEKHIHPFSESGWIRLAGMTGEAEYGTFRVLSARLGKGEASCLSIAEQRKWLFLTDDLEARKRAASMKVSISGTLGCLLLAVEKRHCALERGNGLLLQMIEQGYHSPVRDLRDLVA